MKKRPFFSIPIATYNRSEEVDFAIKRLLAQTFKDFEIIICDDNSTDDTAKRVKAYKDKRVRYYKNPKNLGAVKNIGNVLSYAKGEYVFIHGDDDYLLYDDVLEGVYNLIAKHHYGLIRLNYVYQTFDKKDVFDYVRNKFLRADLQLKAGATPAEIVGYIEKIDLYFITGIIFKNIHPKKITILDSELIPWFDMCYSNIQKYGGFFQQKYSIIASWSHQQKHPGYYVKKGKIAWEELYNAIRVVAGEEYYKKTLNRQLAINVSFLAIIKYNSNNSNLLKYAKRIRELNSSYTFSIKYWLFLLSAFIIPRFVLDFVRKIYIENVKGRGKIEGYSKIINQVYAVRGFDK